MRKGASDLMIWKVTFLGMCSAVLLQGCFLRKANPQKEVLVAIPDPMKPQQTQEQAPKTPEQKVLSPQSDAYPVNPQVHVVDKSQDVLSKKVKPAVSNSVAYARYGVNSFASKAERVSNDVSSIAGRLVAAAESGGMTPQELFELYGKRPSQKVFDDFIAEVKKHGEGIAENYTLSNAVTRHLELEFQVKECSSLPGRSKIACCSAFAYPYFMISDWKEIEKDAVLKASFLEKSKSPTFFKDHAAELLAKPNDTSGSEVKSIFRTTGMQAWLAACSPITRMAPESIEAFKQGYGNYLEGDDWVRELHPVSMAKYGGRRIYRKKDGKVFVSETLLDSCGVKETETMVFREDGNLDFWSYSPDGKRVSYGYFPVEKGKDTIKSDPDSCMGCHYTFDTREFTVAVPSFEALSLSLRLKGDVPKWKDHTHCQKSGEKIIRHEKK